MLGFLRHPNLQALMQFVGWGDEGTPTQPTFEDPEQIPSKTLFRQLKEPLQNPSTLARQRGITLRQEVYRFLKISIYSSISLYSTFFLAPSFLFFRMS